MFRAQLFLLNDDKKMGLSLEETISGNIDWSARNNCKKKIVSCFRRVSLSEILSKNNQHTRYFASTMMIFYWIKNQNSGAQGTKLCCPYRDHHNEPRGFYLALGRKDSFKKF